MGMLASAMCLALLVFPFVHQEDERILLGCELRAVDHEAFAATLTIIRHRVENKRAVESLLVFGPHSDPDILGLIATDESLPLAYREVAANAILDQLYIADPYFQGCAEHYLSILAQSEERSLRLKGKIGSAALEYWYYVYLGGQQNQPPTLLGLRYATERETDSQVKSALEGLAGEDVSALVGMVAWSENLAREQIYRQLDALPSPPLAEEEPPGGEIAGFRETHRAALTLYEKMEPLEEAGSAEGGVPLNLLDELREAGTRVLQGFLARYSATLPAQSMGSQYPPDFFMFFGEIALHQPDPYMRSLALAPIAADSREAAVPFLIGRLSGDESPLVRFSAATFLKAYSREQEVGQRMMVSFRGEEDPRVKLRVLHSLLWPYGNQPPPDIQAFLLARLRDQQDNRLLEYIVVVLGNARVQSAVQPLSNIASRTDDRVLRERIAEALRKIRARSGGS